MFETPLVFFSTFFAIYSFMHVSFLMKGQRERDKNNELEDRQGFRLRSPTS
jgi:hypothetical protein